MYSWFSAWSSSVLYYTKIKFKEYSKAPGKRIMKIQTISTNLVTDGDYSSYINKSPFGSLM